jgi:hypothetical protein
MPTLPELPAPKRRVFSGIVDSLAVVRVHYLVGYGGPVKTTLVSLDHIVPASARDRVLFVVYCADEVAAGATVDLVFASLFKIGRTLTAAGVITAVAVEEVGTSSALEDVISRPTFQEIRTIAAV